MKFLSVILLGFQAIVVSAQISVTKLDGTPINDGDVFGFSSLTEPTNYLGLKVLNNSNQDINVKVKCVDIVNANGSDVQLCFGPVCVPSITIGNSYPNIAAVIEANSANGDFDHFINFNPGTNPSLPVLYTFKFFQVDDNNVEIGNSVTFSYRYVSPLSVSSFSELEQAGVTLKSNLISNNIEINTRKDITITLFDANGKLMVRQNLSVGYQYVDISRFNSGIYLLQVDYKDGPAGTLKLVKQ